MNSNEAKKISVRRHLPPDNTCGGRCFITYGTLLTTIKPILHLPRRTLYKAHLFEPATGASLESLQELPRVFKREIRRLYRKTSVLQMPECTDGCFCNDMVLSPGRLKKETRKIGALLKRGVQSGFIKPDPKNPHQDEQVRSGQLNLLDAHLKPLVIDPEVDIIGASTLLCCGTYDGYVSYNIERRFLYEIDVEAEWKIVSGQGTCANNPELM